MNKRVLTFIMPLLLGIIVCSKSPALVSNDSDKPMSQNHWITQLALLSSQSKFPAPKSNPSPTLSDVIHANIAIVSGQASVIDKLPILGEYHPSVPKAGKQTGFYFRHDNGMATTMHTNTKNDNIASVYVSNSEQEFNEAQLDFSLLKLVFSTYKIDKQTYENDTQYTIRKVFSVKNNPKVKVAFLRSYFEDSTLHQKADFERDKRQLEKLKVFSTVEITNVNE